MKRLAMWSCAVGVMALSLMGMLFVSGCEDGGGGGGGGGSSGGGSVVGTWGNTVFKSDGTWDEYRDAELTDWHLGGTYKQSGNHVTGTGTNPGVGDLEIDGIISDDGQTMELDFIEHWHDPYKHNVSTLTRR